MEITIQSVSAAIGALLVGLVLALVAGRGYAQIDNVLGVKVDCVSDSSFARYYAGLFGLVLIALPLRSLLTLGAQVPAPVSLVEGGFVALVATTEGEFNLLRQRVTARTIGGVARIYLALIGLLLLASELWSAFHGNQVALFVLWLGGLFALIAVADEVELFGFKTSDDGNKGARVFLLAVSLMLVLAGPAIAYRHAAPSGTATQPEPASNAPAALVQRDVCSEPGSAGGPPLATARAVLDRWRDAQNVGDMQAYARLYDGRSFEGIKRTRSGRRDRFATKDAWLLDRRGMFERYGPIKVATLDVTIAAQGRCARIRFEQAWQSLAVAKGYADRGDKELILAPDGDGWLIVREEQLNVRPF